MKERLLRSEIERHFRPEFINRLDEVIVFHPLTDDDLVEHHRYEVAKLGRPPAGQGARTGADRNAKDFLIEKGPTRSSAPVRSAGPSNSTSRIRSARSSDEAVGAGAGPDVADAT
jgi:ATP-dependent Clp protease ATP-binding subunit ClpC